MRAVLYEPPSKAGWMALCQTFDQWPQDQTLEVGVEYAQNLLDAWPDHLRASPRSWLLMRLMPSLHNDQPDPWLPWRLIKHLNLNGLPPRFALSTLLSRRLANWPALQYIQTISARSSGLQDTSLSCLMGSAWLKSLAHLDVGRNRISEQGARAIARAPHIQALRTLDVSITSIGVKGAQHLAHALTMTGIEVLNLSTTGQRPEAARELAAAPNLRALRRLDLSHNSIGDDGAQALVSSPYLSRLEDLRLNRNHIGDLGAVAIAQSPFLKHLKHLNLDGNRIGYDGQRALGKNAHLKAALEHPPPSGTIP